MKIYAKVRTTTSRNEVRKETNGTYKIFVTAAPEKGKANEAAIELLAEAFNIRKNSIRIIKGKMSRDKVFAIGE